MELRPTIVTFNAGSHPQPKLSHAFSGECGAGFKEGCGIRGQPIACCLPPAAEEISGSESAIPLFGC